MMRYLFVQKTWTRAEMIGIVTIAICDLPWWITVPAAITWVLICDGISKSKIGQI